MQQLKRPAVLVAGIATILCIAGSALLPPAAAGPDGTDRTDESASSIAKKPSRITAKTGTYQSNTYDFYALGTLFREGSKYPGRRVVLQARVDGGWTRVDVAQTTVYGTVKWYFKPSSLRWRLKFPGNRTTYADRSATFTFGSGRIAGGEDRSTDPAALVTQAD